MADVDGGTADSWKQKGNDAMKENRLQDALEHYTKGIKIDGSNHVLYSNRSAVYAKLEMYDKALSDAESAIELKPDWFKGYSRMGYALSKLERHEDAKKAYQEGLKLDKDNQQLKDGLIEADRKIMESRNPFNAPDVIDKLSKDPRTAELVKNPDFLKALDDIKGAPTNLAQKLSNPDIVTALSVLMGVDLTTSDSEEDPLVQKPESASNPKPDPDSGSKRESEKPGVEPMDTESKEKALKEKELGNAAYKEKRFEEALSHYDKAFGLDPTNVALLTNKAAVFFEQQRWDECLEMCDLAVEKGREYRVDYQIIAKAFSRKGNVFFKQSKWEDAIKWYDKSLAEHRNPEVNKKKQTAAKKLEEQQNKEYINPEKSLEEKEKGNEAFKKGNYPQAIAHYTEAIKRNPDDAKIYSNRAACYTKLAEFHLGLKDCEECIRLDPTFVKGYLRKGGLHLALKETTKASDAYQKALELDPNSGEAKDGLKKCYMEDDPEARRKRALQDPEIQSILGDPAMQMILQQMQGDPAAIRDHLKNPDIAEKFQKLMEAGILQVR